MQHYLTIISSCIRQMEIKNDESMSHAAENVLTKMMRILEARKELENGNQFFFVASNMIGLLLQSIGEYDRAYLFFDGTQKKQLRYVGEEDDHPFLEQTYSHLALLMKQIQNLKGSLIYWQLLTKTHIRAYGDMKVYLTGDYKNIGNCLLGLNQPVKAIDSFKTAIGYSVESIEKKELSEENIKIEEEELSTLYFSLYLAHNALNQLDEAYECNQKNLELNLKSKGDKDLNVANNYHLAAQIKLKQFKTEEALDLTNKSNSIIDGKEKKQKLLFGRYRLLRAKIYKLLDKDEIAY